MTLTIDINPDAVWEDGSPITWEDFQCTWQAIPEHAGLAQHHRVGQDHLRRGRARATSRLSSVLSEVYAPYKHLFSARAR